MDERVYILCYITGRSYSSIHLIHPLMDGWILLFILNNTLWPYSNEIQFAIQKAFIKEIAFENVSFKMAAILFRPQCIEIVEPDPYCGALTRNSCRLYSCCGRQQRPSEWGPQNTPHCLHPAEQKRERLSLSAFLGTEDIRVHISRVIITGKIWQWLIGAWMNSWHAELLNKDYCGTSNISK